MHTKREKSMQNIKSVSRYETNHVPAVSHFTCSRPLPLGRASTQEGDRAEARRDYNEGLAEGAAGMAELEPNGTFGDVAAAATLRAQHAATYVDHLNAMARELPTE